MKKQKVVFVGIANTDKDFLLAPAYLVSYLYSFEEIKNKYDIKILNYKASVSESKMLADIRKIKPKKVLFSCYLWNISKINNICKNGIEQKPQALNPLQGAWLANEPIKETITSDLRFPADSNRELQTSGLEPAAGMYKDKEISQNKKYVYNIFQYLI